MLLMKDVDKNGWFAYQNITIHMENHRFLEETHETNLENLPFVAGLPI